MHFITNVNKIALKHSKLKLNYTGLMSRECFTILGVDTHTCILRQKKMCLVHTSNFAYAIHHIGVTLIIEISGITKEWYIVLRGVEWW